VRLANHLSRKNSGALSKSGAPDRRPLARSVLKYEEFGAFRESIFQARRMSGGSSAHEKDAPPFVYPKPLRRRCRNDGFLQTR
jgi:hypothetical protein